MLLEQRQCFRCYLYTNRIRKTEWAVVVERNPRWLQQWCQKSGEAYGQTWQIRVKEHSILIIYGVWDALRDSEVQKPSRETLFSEWSSGSSPGLNVETCDSLALLQQLCVCVCVCTDIYIHTYIWDFYGNYNIWLYIYEWRYIWLRKWGDQKQDCVSHPHVRDGLRNRNSQKKLSRHDQMHERKSRKASVPEPTGGKSSKAEVVVKYSK